LLLRGDATRCVQAIKHAKEWSFSQSRLKGGAFRGGASKQIFKAFKGRGEATLKKLWQIDLFKCGFIEKPKPFQPSDRIGETMQIGQKNKIFIFFFLAVFFVGSSLCFAASLRWDPPSQGTVTGYRVKHGTSSSTPSTTVGVGTATQYNLDNAPLAENRTYYFWVTAYNATGESAAAGPVSYNTSDATPPVPPTGVTAN